MLIALASFSLEADDTASHETLTLNEVEVVWALALLPIPLANGVAALRHRLYDLGRLVSRTVSYGFVSAALVGLYALLVAGAAV